MIKYISVIDLKLKENFSKLICGSDQRLTGNIYLVILHKWLAWNTENKCSHSLAALMQFSLSNIIFKSNLSNVKVQLWNFKKCVKITWFVTNTQTDFFFYFKQIPSGSESESELNQIPLCFIPPEYCPQPQVGSVLLQWDFHEIKSFSVCVERHINVLGISGTSFPPTLFFFNRSFFLLAASV